MRFFLDTNVIVSAWYGPGNERSLLGRLGESGHDIVVSEFVLGELRSVLSMKLEISFQEAEAVIGRLRAVAVVCPSRKGAGLEGNPKDAQVTHDAQLAQCEFLVTGDRWLLRRKQVGSTHIVRTVDALRILGFEPRKPF